MWLGHSIEHLVCIGGELEHHKALPSPARKNRAVWSALLAGEGVYIATRPLVPVRAYNWDKWVLANRDKCLPRPGRPPGRTNQDVCPAWVPVRAEPGLMGWSGPNQSPVFY